MTIHLRSAISLYVAFIALFIVFDRSGFFGDSGLAATVLLTVVAAAVMMLTLPPASRVMLPGWLALWLVIYGLLRWLASRLAAQPWLIPGQPIQAMSEAGFVLMGAWLAYRMGHGVQVLETAVTRMTLGDQAGRVSTLEQAADNIGREFARSRRYGYPLTVVMLELDRDTVNANLNRAVLQLQRSSALRYVLGNLVGFIHDHLRRTDLILDPEAEGRLVLLTPDTDLKSAQQLAARIQAVAAERFHVRMNYGSATFPEDAVSFDELMDLARDRLVTQTLPDRPVGPVELAAPEGQGVRT